MVAWIQSASLGGEGKGKVRGKGSILDQIMPRRAFHTLGSSASVEAAGAGEGNISYMDLY